MTHAEEVARIVAQMQGDANFALALMRDLRSLQVATLWSQIDVHKPTPSSVRGRAGSHGEPVCVGFVHYIESWDAGRPHSGRIAVSSSGYFIGSIEIPDEVFQEIALNPDKSALLPYFAKAQAMSDDWSKTRGWILPMGAV